MYICLCTKKALKLFPAKSNGNQSLITPEKYCDYYIIHVYGGVNNSCPAAKAFLCEHEVKVLSCNQP